MLIFFFLQWICVFRQTRCHIGHCFQLWTNGSRVVLLAVHFTICALRCQYFCPFNFSIAPRRAVVDKVYLMITESNLGIMIMITCGVPPAALDYNCYLRLQSFYSAGAKVERKGQLKQRWWSMSSNQITINSRDNNSHGRQCN